MITDRLIVKWDQEYECYDVEVIDHRASAGDFEMACEQLMVGPKAMKLKKKNCIGCSICCTGRIPLTSIDVIRLSGGMRNIGGWVKKYARIDREGECIDITMEVDPLGLCRHWNKNEGRCRVYPLRALACRTYICTPMSHRLELLRAELINQGEDELVRLVVNDRSKVYDQKNAFAGKESYQQVLLSEICSKRLWRYLISHD